MTEPRGTIYLIARAPITADYQHTIDFKSPSEQQSYWGSLSRYMLTEYSYVRRERQFIRVDKSFEELEGINYMMYQNRDNGKWCYGFVTDREYKDDNVTWLYFELDVLQSFMFDYELKPSYISQSHVDRWDANHKPIYSRTDEGLDYGSEYTTEAAYKIKHSKDYLPKHGFYIVFCAGIPATMISEGASNEPTKIENNPIPYALYLIPNIEQPTLDNYGFIDVTYNDPNSTETPIASGVMQNMHKFQTFMAHSAFGNYVKQIIYVPYLPDDYIIEETYSQIEQDGSISGMYGFKFPKSYDGGAFDVYPQTIMQTQSEEDSTPLTSYKALKITEIHPDKLIKDLASTDIFAGLEAEMPQAAQWEELKSNPRKMERDRRFESKLLCFPYRYNVFTDWITAPALIKNEYIGSDKITIKQSVGFGFNMPRRFWVDNYRKDPEGRESGIMQTLPMEQPIISDAYYTYLLQNRNQISANITNGLISAIANTGSAVVSGAGTGGLAGGAVAGASAALSGAINVSAMLRSENAKQKDLKTIPDSFSNTADCNFNITDESKYLTFYRKKICCEFAEQLAQYWHMFGYKVNRVEVPNTRSRVRYNFIKTIGANIVGDIEHAYISKLKEIYDTGVTFWHYSAADFHPMDYTFENVEVNLL